MVASSADAVKTLEGLTLAFAAAVQWGEGATFFEAIAHADYFLATPRPTLDDAGHPLWRSA